MRVSAQTYIWKAGFVHPMLNATERGVPLEKMHLCS